MIFETSNEKIVTVDDVSEMDEDFFGRIEALYDPCRVMIEWNGIWPQDQLKLPDSWQLFQQITIVDGSTFELYLNNMKPLLGLMVRNSELVIVNRCDDVSRTTSYGAVGAYHSSRHRQRDEGGRSGCYCRDSIGQRCGVSPTHHDGYQRRSDTHISINRFISLA